MSIPLMNLEVQFNLIKGEVEKELNEVFKSGQFILGSKVKELEEKIASFCGRRYGVGVASGTDALILSLEALGIKQGDEVITTPYTFIATAEAISRVGATPVFVDIDPKTYNLDPQLIKERITERTKAIIPVHIFGYPAEMDKILEISKKYRLKVIEDACQAIGAEYKGKPIGSFGDASCFSFFPSKNLGGAGDGGMILTNDAELAQKLRMLRHHGSEKKYYHKILGFNSRLDEIQAAILLVKFKYLKEWTEKRRRKAQIYHELLHTLPLELPFESAYAKHVYHLYIVRTRKRDLLVEALKRNSIGTGIYYPLPLHLQQVYSHLSYSEGDLPESERASRETCALPLFPEITDEQINQVVKVVGEALQ